MHTSIADTMRSQGSRWFRSRLSKPPSVDIFAVPNPPIAEHYRLGKSFPGNDDIRRRTGDSEVFGQIGQVHQRFHERLSNMTVKICKDTVDKHTDARHIPDIDNTPMGMTTMGKLTFTIYVGGIEWDTCKAWTIKQAQAIAEERYSDRVAGSVWVRVATGRRAAA